MVANIEEKYNNDRWCLCLEDPPIEKWLYFEDAQHSVVHKHHWRCTICGGILQIG
jgi:hypothetical protein